MTNLQSKRLHTPSFIERRGVNGGQIKSSAPNSNQVVFGRVETKIPKLPQSTLERTELVRLDAGLLKEHDIRGLRKEKSVNLVQVKRKRPEVPSE